MSPSPAVDPHSVFVEKMGNDLVRAGMPRMAARVFAAVLSSEGGKMTAADLGELLKASPAAISGAVRYLEQVDMVVRYREPGSRRDVFALGEDVWYEAFAHKDEVLSQWMQTAAEGVELFGVDTEVGRRLDEAREFDLFMIEEVPLLIERWRVRRDKLRAERGDQPD
ncbi:MarR family protein [Antricoccus suffuscus]|uniref:MarR family protein n=1 Tax=Antricoccus suffuscus TaxID=1629062 RepID=A0A2T0ZZ81_9ACTN|nr:MarR family transcriptional regulator [Antricoccus suffuscus]PRZ41661.1 MarR family protein [Antricoccus suffuscus]